MSQVGRECQEDPSQKAADVNSDNTLDNGSDSDNLSVVGDLRHRNVDLVDSGMISKLSDEQYN